MIACMVSCRGLVSFHNPNPNTNPNCISYKPNLNLIVLTATMIPDVRKLAYNT